MCVMASLVDFLSDESGSATVEFVIWVPWFMLLLMITTDVSFVWFNHTQMLNTSRDAARRMSIGELSGADLESFVRARVSGSGVRVVDRSSGNDACVQISRPFTDCALFGWTFKGLWDKDLAATTVMLRELGSAT